MSVVIGTQNNNRAVSIPISEQNKILTWLIQKIKSSNIFRNYEINFNDLKSDKSNVCILLLSGSTKSRQYVDGGYDATIPFQFIFRTLGSVTDNTRLNAIDLVNQLGMWLDENVHYNKEISGYTIYSVTQETQATIDYRDESGTEDASAQFRISYSRN